MAGVPDEAAEQVWGLELARPRTVADRPHGQRGHRAGRPGEGREDGRARRRDELGADPRVDDGETLEQLGGPRAGDRDPAVGPVDGAPADRQGRHVHRLDAEQAEPGHGAGDVDDRVQCADVVEVDGLHGGAVGAGLGLGQAAEDPGGVAPHAGRETAPVEEPEDTAERAVRAGWRPRVDLDIGLGGPESAPPDLVRRERPAGEAELRELRAERVEGHPRVEKRAEDHVARGAARAVEVDRLHLILWIRRLIRDAWQAAP